MAPVKGRPIDDPLTLGTIVVILAAVSVGATAKGVTGIGLPLLAIPLMSMFLGVQHAVVVMALPTIVSNILLLWEHRAFADQTRHLWTVGGLGAITAVLGALAVDAAGGRWLALALGGLLMFYLAVRLWQPDAHLSEPTTRRMAPAVGLVAGLLHGTTGVSGPVLITYVHSFGLPRQAFVFSVAALFEVFAIMQLSTFAWVGLFDSTRVVETLVALIPMATVMPLAMRMARKLDAAVFGRILLALIALMGTKLLLQAAGISIGSAG